MFSNDVESLFEELDYFVDPMDESGFQAFVRLVEVGEVYLVVLYSLKYESTFRTS